MSSLSIPPLGGFRNDSARYWRRSVVRRTVGSFRRTAVASETLVQKMSNMVSNTGAPSTYAVMCSSAFRSTSPQRALELLDEAGRLAALPLGAAVHCVVRLPLELFGDISFVDQLRVVCSEHLNVAQYLMLELPSNALSGQVASRHAQRVSAVGLVAELRWRGFRVAIGCDSLADLSSQYSLRPPVDAIRIGPHLVSALTELAKRLPSGAGVPGFGGLALVDAPLICDDIRTPAQLQRAESLGATWVFGDLLGAACPISEEASLLQSRSSSKHLLFEDSDPYDQPDHSKAPRP